MSVTEGSTATYTVVLDTAPSANVTIAVANRGQSADDSDLTVSPASLTFTSSNWNTTGTVTVSAAQDADTADGTAVITHTATSTDSNYGGITIADVTATEDDDDTPPTSADVTLAVSRDNRTAIPLSRFPFSDADGGTLRGVKIVTLPAPSAGTLGLVKTGIYAGAATTVLCVGTIDAIVAGQEVLNAVSSVLYFCPKDGFTHATFRFQVIDSQGRSSTRTQSTGQTNIATLVGPPGQVTGLAAEAGSGYVRLIWTDPQNPAITGYEVPPEVRRQRLRRLDGDDRHRRDDDALLGQQPDQRHGVHLPGARQEQGRRRPRALGRGHRHARVGGAGQADGVPGLAGPL